MTPNWKEIEAALLTAYTEQAPLYAQALALANDLSTLMSESGKTEQGLQSLAELMQQIAAMDAGMASHREQWLVARRKAGAPLAATMKQVTELIEQLRTTISELEKLAIAKRDQLIPQMDGVVRSRQMKRAYASASTYGSAGS